MFIMLGLESGASAMLEVLPGPGMTAVVVVGLTPTEDKLSSPRCLFALLSPPILPLRIVGEIPEDPPPLSLLAIVLLLEDLSRCSRSLSLCSRSLSSSLSLSRSLLSSSSSSSSLISPIRTGGAEPLGKTLPPGGGGKDWFSSLTGGAELERKG